MILELTDEDLKPENKDCNASRTSFSKFKDEVQLAIRVVGKAMYFGFNRDTHNAIYPPASVPAETGETSTKAKRQYRIESWRFDVPIETVETPTFEGETEKACDEKAIARMNALSGQETYSWDGLRVSRIDQPAIPEKSTFLADNGRQKGD